ncbi:MAG TPA: hypothetical protein VMB18_06750 [Terriglobales bacterium]|nr:hypothetical protein [Terriglobales bacterium]
MPASKPVAASIPDVVDELDADDTRDCLALGELDISFHTDNDGPPDVGVVLTDPWGRRVGFDPLTKHAWQDLPVAQGDIDCDLVAGRNNCRGLVQICGPLSGTYKLELIAQKTTAYSVSISARSAQILEGNGVQSSHSQAGLNDVGIRGGSRDVVLLNYSRDPQEKIAAQLQHPVEARKLDTSPHSQPELEATKK